jgi:hypothetical protein
MNWRRGLLRVYLVVSLGWIGFVTWTFYETVWAPRRAAAVASDCANARTANPSLGNPFDCFPLGNAFADLIPIGDALMRFAAVAFGPVIGLLVISLLLQWIASGFRKPT